MTTSAPPEALPLISSVAGARGNPVRLGAVDPTLPMDLVNIVHRCLELEPQRRYSSARALAIDANLRRRIRPDLTAARSLAEG